MKVVIAGGGAVGTFIAGELQQAGHDVHIIEQDEDLVAGLEAGVAPRDDHPVVAEHGHHGGVPGQAELDDLLVARRAVAGQRHLDEARPPALERQQPHQRADADRLLDQGGEQVGRGHGHVDAPVLVEHPLVLRVVDPGHDAGDGELLLGQQADDQVVLVVAGDRRRGGGGHRR